MNLKFFKILILFLAINYFNKIFTNKMKIDYYIV